MILAGITVLDFSVSVAGPMATAMLADSGARVIKIEPTGGELTNEWDSLVHGLSSSYVWNARNKETIALNLKDRRGVEIAHRLMSRADIVVESFSPGTIDRLQLGYNVARALNPLTIYCHISGYGQTGPFRDEKAFDFLIQGEAGLVAMTGTSADICKVPLSVADIAAAMYANQAILLALIERESSGEGQEIDISMLHCLTSWLGYHAYFSWFTGKDPQPIGARHHALFPYGPYSCSDGEIINIAVLTQAMWVSFCNHVLSAPELARDERFKTNELRLANREHLELAISKAFSQKKACEWTSILRKSKIPMGRVLNISDTLKHPQLQHRRAFAEAPSAAGPIPAIVSPVRMSRSHMRYDWVPLPGEYTRQILSDLDFPSDEIDELITNGVVDDGRKQSSEHVAPA